jgi:short-subunit dehydrogenase
MPQTRPVALITGASSGIGKALADNFAEHGYDVILAARSVDKMESHAAELQMRFGITAIVIASDLESSRGAAELHAEIKRRGFTLSALVNNAGYGTFGEFKDASLDAQLAMMQLNMSSLVALAKLFLPDLLATKGKMLNLASTAAFQPGPYMAVYYATKAFVLSFSEALAAELAETGVTVTALCPGPTASGFQDKAAMHHSGMVKGKRLPTSEEVARKGFRAMQRGRRVYIPGLKNWALAQLPRLSPRRLVTTIVIWVTGPVE